MPFLIVGQKPVFRVPYTAGGGGGGGTAILSDDFESGSDGQTMTARSYIRSSGTVSTTRAFSGTKSAKLSQTAGSDCDQSYGLAKALPVNLVQGDEFWIRFKFFYPTGWDFGNDGNAGLGGNAPRSKFFRLHTQTAGGTNKGYNDLYLWEEDASTTRWNWIKEQNDAWAYSGLDGFAPGRPAAPTTAIARNTWCSVEYYIKLHATPASALVRVWVNNTIEVNISDLATLTSSTDVANEWQFCTYYNGGAPATQDMWIDDVQVYTSASPPTNTDAGGRIFIGGS